MNTDNVKQYFKLKSVLFVRYGSTDDGKCIMKRL